MDNETKLKPALYLVPTPIGNLEDITLRAMKILRQADIIACEDTRHTGQFLKLLDIKNKKLSSYHEQNEKEKAIQLVHEIIDGSSVALVSDAGTPGISDPGYRIIQSAIENHVEIISLPGPSAFLPALIASGLPFNNFIFLGFPPQKKGRKTFLNNLKICEYTSILYESPFRIIKLLDELIEMLGENHKICVAREISKIFEEYIRGTLSECSNILKKRTVIKGEFVVVIAGIK
jgi:16S rRNA (cytidine1402-2'-O)-methyltransferase